MGPPFHTSFWSLFTSSLSSSDVAAGDGSVQPFDLGNAIVKLATGGEVRVHL